MKTLESQSAVGERCLMLGEVRLTHSRLQEMLTLGEHAGPQLNTQFKKKKKKIEYNNTEKCLVPKKIQ